MGNISKIKGRGVRPHEHQDQEEEEDEALWSNNKLNEKEHQHMRSILGKRGWSSLEQ
jgi:hypothetical protein